MIDTRNWRAEYEDFARSEREILGMAPRIVSEAAPKPKLSSLLECVNAARRTPEIWSLAAKEFHNRSSPAKLTEDHQFTEICSQFTQWYQYVTGTRSDLPLAYSQIQNVLLHSVANDADMLEAVRQCIQPSVYIDDIAQNIPHGEEK